MSKRTLTEVYIGFLLIIVIIMLMTVKWFEIPKLVEYMSFASSIASIILAVLAIAYSVLSSSSMDRSLGSITSSVTQMQAATASNLELYHQLREELKGSSGVFETGLQSVTSQIQSLTPFKDSNFGIQPVMENEKGVKEDTKVGIEILQLIEISSVSGALLLYCCVKCFKKGSMFKISDLVAIIPSDQSYLQGYLVASHASGALQLIFPSVSKPIAVQSIQGDLDQAQAACLARVEKFSRRSKTKPKDAERIRVALKDLDNYLETGAVPVVIENQDASE